MNQNNGEPGSAPGRPEAVRNIGDFSVRVIREMRGALDDEQARELTLDQCDMLRRDGELKLTDPETGIEYILVPTEEFARFRGR